MAFAAGLAERVADLTPRTFAHLAFLAAAIFFFTGEETALVIAANQGKAANHEELEHMLSELEAPAEEEAQRLVAEENPLGR